MLQTLSFFLINNNSKYKNVYKEATIYSVITAAQKINSTLF